MPQSILLYGESGVYKTTQIGLYADYQFNRTGKPTRLITCDSGLAPVSDQIMRGTLIVLRLESCPHPIPVMNKLSKGQWPVKAIDSDAGLWDCRPGASFEQVAQGISTGAYAVEGLTRICELVRKAWTDDQQQIGEPLQGCYEQDGEKFAFQSRGTLFATQQLINNFVINFRGLPVDRVLFTAHESKGRDIGGREILGPGTTGQALTDKVPGWFEVCLHHESYQYSHKLRDGRTVVRTGVRVHFARHPDKQIKGMYWPAKLGVNPAITSRIYDIHEDGSFPLVMDGEQYISGLHTFLYLIDNEGSYETREPIEAAQSHGEFVPPELDSQGEQDEGQGQEAVAGIQAVVGVDTGGVAGASPADAPRTVAEDREAKQGDSKRGRGRRL